MHPGDFIKLCFVITEQGVIFSYFAPEQDQGINYSMLFPKGCTIFKLFPSYDFVLGLCNFLLFLLDSLPYRVINLKNDYVLA